jgi:hypothetical protein
MGLDSEVVAVCECGADRRCITFRKLKRTWPHCKCRSKLPLKVIPNAVAPVPTEVGLGDADGTPRPTGRKGDRH